MAEATTYGATVAALQQLDQKAQLSEHAAQTCASGVQGMTNSQAALDAALTKFKLDQRTLGASKRLQEATGALERAVAATSVRARCVSESTQTALQTVGEHRQLAQAVQEHGEAAEMEWYRNGR